MQISTVLFLLFNPYTFSFLLFSPFISCLWRNVTGNWPLPCLVDFKETISVLHNFGIAISRCLLKVFTVCYYDEEILYFAKSFSGTRGWWDEVRRPEVSEFSCILLLVPNNPVVVPYRFPPLVFFFFLIEVWELFKMYSEYKSFIRDILCKYFLPVHYFFCHSLKSAFWRAEVFNLLKPVYLFSLCSIKSFPNPESQRIFPQFSSKSFVVFVLH